MPQFMIPRKKCELTVEANTRMLEADEDYVEGERTW